MCMRYVVEVAYVRYVVDRGCWGVRLFWMVCWVLYALCV